MSKIKDKLLEMFIGAGGIILSILFFLATTFIGLLIPMLMLKWVLSW